MVQMLRDGKTVVIIPGGVAECMAMERGVETLYLRKRFGFVKVAIQTGSDLIPAFTFGQSNSYGYWRLGPPLVSKSTANWIGKTFSFAPIVFWGKWCSPIPYSTPLDTVVGKPIAVVQNPSPSNEEVALKLDEFIDAMESLYERHKAKYGYEDKRLVIC
jgi:2-acylglycerol O-acyltransferase 2